MNSLIENVIDRVRAVIEPLLAEQGLELVDVEYRREGRGRVLRIYIDKEGGVTIGNCADISRELGSILNVHDAVPGPYTLEVSSPGLDRALKKPKDFMRFRGKKVRVKTKSYIEDKSFFMGRLMAFENDVATVEADGKVYSIPFDEIEKANLELEF